MIFRIVLRLHYIAHSSFVRSGSGFRQIHPGATPSDGISFRTHHIHIHNCYRCLGYPFCVCAWLYSRIFIIVDMCYILSPALWCMGCIGMNNAKCEKALSEWIVRVKGRRSIPLQLTVHTQNVEMVADSPANCLQQFIQMHLMNERRILLPQTVSTFAFFPLPFCCCCFCPFCHWCHRPAILHVAAIFPEWIEVETFYRFFFYFIHIVYYVQFVFPLPVYNWKGVIASILPFFILYTYILVFSLYFHIAGARLWLIPLIDWHYGWWMCRRLVYFTIYLMMGGWLG